MFINKKVGDPYPCKYQPVFFVHTRKGYFRLKKKKNFSDSFFGGLGEYYIQKWLKNSKKNSLVLGGLKRKRHKRRIPYAGGGWRVGAKMATQAFSYMFSALWLGPTLATMSLLFTPYTPQPIK
jgi:hypothetical protein